MRPIILIACATCLLTLTSFSQTHKKKHKPIAVERDSVCKPELTFKYASPESPPPIVREVADPYPFSPWQRVKLYSCFISTVAGVYEMMPFTISRDDYQRSPRKEMTDTAEMLVNSTLIK